MARSKSPPRLRKSQRQALMLEGTGQSRRTRRAVRCRAWAETAKRSWSAQSDATRTSSRTSEIEITHAVTNGSHCVAMLTTWTPRLFRSLESLHRAFEPNFDAKSSAKHYLSVSAPMAFGVSVGNDWKEGNSRVARQRRTRASSWTRHLF
ncbi:hypothetical protein BKA80DRAFT_3632 [Phyllosticta citrichinensis]